MAVGKIPRVSVGFQEVWSILPVDRLMTITTLEAIPCSRWHGLLTLHEHPTWWLYVSLQCGEGRPAPCQSLDLLAILDLRSIAKVLLSISFSLAVRGLHLACGGLELVSNCVAFVQASRPKPHVRYRTKSAGAVNCVASQGLFSLLMWCNQNG